MVIISTKKYNKLKWNERNNILANEAASFTKIMSNCVRKDNWCKVSEENDQILMKSKNPGKPRNPRPLDISWCLPKIVTHIILLGDADICLYLY